MTMEKEKIMTKKDDMGCELRPIGLKLLDLAFNINRAKCFSFGGLKYLASLTREESEVAILLH